MTLRTSVPIPFDDQFLRFLAAEESASDRLRAFYAQSREELRAFLLDPPIALTASEQAFFNGIQAEVNRLADAAQIEASKWVAQSVPAAFVEGALQHSPGMAFNVIHDDAVKALSSYNLNLITRMNDGMRRIVQQQIGVGLLQGLTRQQVSDRILASGLSNIPHWRTVEDRAAAIARTEMMRAYNAGNLTGILDSGAKAARWITGADERVCPICGPRHDQKYRISGVDSDDDRVKALDDLPGGPPPAHVKCRCTIRAFYFDAEEAVKPTPVPGGIIDQALDEKRIVAWQAQPTASLRKLLARTDLHPKDRAEIAAALARKTGTALKPGIAAQPATAASTVERATSEWARSVWGTKSGEFYKSLSRFEMDAISRYSGKDYVAINRYLRRRVKNAAARVTKTIEGRIEALNSAIARTPIPRAIRVTRGTTLSAFDGYDPALFIGKTITEPGFLSTSTKQLEGFGGFQGRVIMNITAPKGTPALYMEPVTSVKGEQEILFGAGTRLRIDAVRRIDHRASALKQAHSEYRVDATIVS